MILAEIREITMSSLWVRRLLPWLAFFLVAVNALVIQHPFFGFGSLLFWIGSLGYVLGPRVAPPLRSSSQTIVGVLATIALLSLAGCAVYYLTIVSTATLLIASGGVTLLASLVALTPPPYKSSPKELFLGNISAWSLFTLGILALSSWWVLLNNNPIEIAVRTPWQAIPVIAIVSLGIGFVAAITLLWREQTKMHGTLLLALSLFSLLSMAAVVYPLGYGFDPFLHRATVTHILEHGTITPKPLYYIGEYALELIATKLGSLPLMSVNTLLAPFLAAFGITGIAYVRSLHTHLHPFALASLLLLPMAAFVQTTPQALAFIFTAWCLLTPQEKPATPALFALAAVFTHPLAGIPSVIYVTLLLLTKLQQRHRTLGTVLITFTAILGSFAIPTAFALQAKLSGLPLSFHPLGLFNLQQLPLRGFLGTQFNSIGDLGYLIIENYSLLILVLAVCGIALSRATAQSLRLAPALAALVTFLNFVFLSLVIDFRFLISYERIDFALRLLTATALLLLPYLGTFFARLREILAQRPLILRAGLYGLLCIAALAQSYGAYPRHDNYARSAGFNVTFSDMHAVQEIETQAQGTPYIVLSDQALAAAAVRAFGFKQYYHDDIFFYPIPTGGPLYTHFLTMVENKPTIETVHAAMDLAGVDLAFFAVHNYWWQANAIVENTKPLADTWFTVDNNEVTVFIFTR